MIGDEIQHVLKRTESCLWVLYHGDRGQSLEGRKKSDLPPQLHHSYIFRAVEIQLT